MATLDPNTIVQLALAALNNVLAVIAEVRSQGGMTDDQIADHVKTITAGNDAAYTQIMAALKPPPAA